MEGTSAHRAAGAGLLILGGLNALLGLLGLVGGGDVLVFGVTLAGGLVVAVLGWLVRRGSRPVTLAALVLLALFGLSQLVLLLTTGDLTALVWVAVAGLLGWLSFRALQRI